MVVALDAELEVWEVLDTHELSSPVVPCFHVLRQGSAHYILPTPHMGRAHSRSCIVLVTVRTGCKPLDPCKQVWVGHTQMVANLVQLVRSSPPV